MTRKVSRTYRLSEATISMVDQLQQMVGAASATETIELAVARWHGAENERRGKMDEKLIEIGFHGADLFNGWDSADLDAYDEAASAQAFADELAKALEAAYPGYEVKVSYDLDAGGALPYPLQTRISGIGAADATDAEMAELEYIASIETRVYQEYDWLVPASD